MKNSVKKSIKFRIQKDWMVAISVMTTFLFLRAFGEIEWKWFWLISPVWVLLSIYVSCTIVAMSIYLISKRFRK